MSKISLPHSSRCEAPPCCFGSQLAPQRPWEHPSYPKKVPMDRILLPWRFLRLKFCQSENMQCCRMMQCKGGVEVPRSGRDLRKAKARLSGKAVNFNTALISIWKLIGGVWEIRTFAFHNFITRWDLRFGSRLSTSPELGTLLILRRCFQSYVFRQLLSDWTTTRVIEIPGDTAVNRPYNQAQSLSPFVNMHNKA